MSDPTDGNMDIELGVLKLFRRTLTRAADDTDDSSSTELDPIRTQKLVLAGVRHFGLEDRVTIQWYLDGDMLPRLSETGDDVAIVTNAGYDEGPFPTEEEVYRFYTEELSNSFPTGETLPEILEQDPFEWLETYYRAKDIPFSEVYRTNLEIYLRLRHLQQYYDPDHSRESLPDSDPATVADDISDATMRMKTAMTRYILFQSLGPYVTEFDRIAGQILSEISADLDSDHESRSNHKILISHLGRFYYHAIWEPIAARMGYYTVEAPSQEQLDDTRSSRVKQLKLTRTRFFDELEKLRSRTDEFGIRLETRTERLPRINPEESGLENVLSLDMDELSGEQAAEG
ncbi:hypothetical protein [Halosimplex halobium]|uniref:hypothetical protein n=1 Tax=Halosimplex halobium TaxID=3396618 RepID=UPI003F55D5EF